MAELGYNTKAKIPKGHLQGTMHGSVLEVSALLSLPRGKGHCVENRDPQCENYHGWQGIPCVYRELTRLGVIL